MVGSRRTCSHIFRMEDSTATFLRKLTQMLCDLEIIPKHRSRKSENWHFSIQNSLIRGHPKRQEPPSEVKNRQAKRCTFTFLRYSATHDTMWTNPCKLSHSYHKLHDSISMTCIQYKYADRKENGCQGLEGQPDGEWWIMGTGVLLEVTNILTLTVVVIAELNEQT